VPADPAGLTPTAANLLLHDVVPGHRVTSCVLRTGGELSQAYEARFSDDTDPLIIKIYTGAWRWKQAKETVVYQMLEQHLVGPIPRILHAGAAPGQAGGHSYTVMTLLPGQPLSAVSAGLDESELFGVYRQLGAAGAGRRAVYRLYHALELWDWFASIGRTQPLGGLARDMSEVITPSRRPASGAAVPDLRRSPAPS
jgi:hypothetical protein